jgi:steroid 5-alpha reductase family enzyme
MTIVSCLTGLAGMTTLAAATWLVSLRKRDVSIVDSTWSLMILTGAVLYAAGAERPTYRTWVILGLVALWAVRLSAYLTWRNWGEPEDRRYREIREKYEPGFAWKSLGIIFIFQAVLAWLASLPLWPALTTAASIGLLDWIGFGLFSVGLAFETIGDWQLARFKADSANGSLVMDRGLWRYTRHPNYFGECVLWWGFYLFAVSAGAWWTLPAPLLLTWLLLKFSGVALLESTIVARRPEYREYVARTNAFLPGRPRRQGMGRALKEQAS